MRRKLASAVTPACAIVAFLSYAGVLTQGRITWSNASQPAAASGAFGADANRFRGAVPEPELHSIAMGTLPNSDSHWLLPEPVAPANARHLAVVFAADGIEFLKPDANVTIWLGQSQLATIRPPGSASAFPLSIPSEPVSLAPGATEGYRFDFPAHTFCPRRRCSVSVTLHSAAWRIYRLAIEARRSLYEAGVTR
jgi:hypothetical protein